MAAKRKKAAKRKASKSSSSSRARRRRRLVPAAFVQPYDDMADEAVELWAEVVRTYAVDYFTNGQRPLLRSYCTTIVLTWARSAGFRSSNLAE